MDIKEAKQRYREHKNNARGRKIDFIISFDEWYKIWFDSGKWSQRGNKAGCYVMGRFGDVGPYSVNNVRIISFEQNNSEGHDSNPRSAEQRAKNGKAGAKKVSVSMKKMGYCKYCECEKTRAHINACKGKEHSQKMKEYCNG